MQSRILAGLCAALTMLAFTLAWNADASSGIKSDSKVKAKAVVGKAGADGKQTLTITLEIEKGWYIYANPVGDEDFEPNKTRVTVKAKDKVELDNKCCHFTPHVQMLRTTQTLVVKNSDPIAHNSNLQGFTNPGANPLIPAMKDVELTFPAEESLPITASCKIHSWMKGYVVIRSNPYMAVSDAKGNFTIKDLPAGKDLEFQLWQEKAGYLKNVSFKKGKADSKGRFKIKLTAGDTDLGDMKVPAADFSK